MRAWALCLGVLLPLAACGEEDRTPSHFTPSSDRRATSADDTLTRLASAVPGAIEPPRRPLPPPAAAGVALSPTDTASLRGIGRLAGAGRLTSVSVALTGGKAGTSYQGAIRQGGCARTGATVASLNPVSADSLGLGAASTHVSVPIDSVLGGRHVVVYGKGGRPETCGEIGSPPGPGSPRRED